jgi:hypothetical protein
MTSSIIPGHINHVVLVLDESLSMRSHARDFVKVVDGEVTYLARRSQELDQETRVTVYTFGEEVRCLVYDKDVLRLPSIESLYRPAGRTKLIDATVQAIDELGQTATLYGDHAFLAYVLTDGEENASWRRPADLASRLRALPENWTVATLVPNQRGVREAKVFGFPAENIEVWDTTNAGGVVEAGATMRRATESFLVGRSQGIRGTRSLFSTGSEAVNRSTVTGLTSLTPGSFFIKAATCDTRMDEMTTQIGKGFYKLIKREEIQPQKQIAIRERSTGKVYLDAQARSVLGLPDMAVKVSPSFNPDYDVFVQSTAPNRKIPAGSEALVLR